MVELLLSHKDIVVNSKEDTKGGTPLHWAASEGQDKIVRLLLDDERVDINAKAKDGETPLNLAAGKNHKDIVRMLLSNRRLTTPNDVDHLGEAPVMTALVSKSTDALHELVNHPCVDLGQTDGRGVWTKWQGQYFTLFFNSELFLQ